MAPCESNVLVPEIQWSHIYLAPFLLVATSPYEGRSYSL